MRSILKPAMAPFFGLVLFAADPAWKTKQLQDWTAEDATQVLRNSAWVKRTRPAALLKISNDQLRSGGRMGGGTSAGITALSPSNLTGLGSPEPGKRRLTQGQVSPVEVRWESAAVLHAAEQKLHDTDAPSLTGNAYVLAVYDVPGLDADDKSLATDFKHTSWIKPDRKKAIKPVRVTLLPQVGGLVTIVYEFPRAQEITLDDNRVEFVTQFGRLSVAQYFYLQEMQFQGKLDL